MFQYDVALELDRVRRRKGCRSSLQAARVLRGLKREELARQLDVPVDVIDQLERGISGHTPFEKLGDVARCRSIC